MKNRIYKGDIYYVDLSGTIGSEQSGTRPVIVVQNDVGNKYSSTIIIVPLTRKNIYKLKQPTHFLLKRTGKIRYDSIVLTEQVKVIDKRRIRRKIGHLNRNTMKIIDQKIMIALGISKF